MSPSSRSRRLDPDTNELRLFFCSAEYYAHKQGPHSRLRCTACHPREQVSMIPHENVQPVSCATECHIVPASGMELRFQHDRPASSLAASVHGNTALEDWDPEQPLLRPGQSSCLYCHDEPVYRNTMPESSSHRGLDATRRCETCHDETLPVDASYYLRHTTSRLQPARPVRQLVQVCAVCRADPDAIEHMESHDAVASYLHSFHGKASLLGSHETATCVDCHSSEEGDVHLMLAANDPASPTHPDRVTDTCRTAQCHASASPEMSSAAVHLELDPRARNLEYYFAAGFILLTAGVMTVYFLLILLELLNAVVRPADPEHRRLVQLARAVLAHPDGAAGEGPGQLHYPYQVALGADGTALVTDVLNARVQVIPRSRRPAYGIGTYGVDLGELYRPKGVAVDGSGNVWVSDSVLGVVQVFSQRGALLDVLRGSDGAVLFLDGPAGLAFDRGGNLYVVEQTANRVRRLAIERRVTPVLARSSALTDADLLKPRGCTACHFEWMPPLVAGRSTALAPPPPNTVSQPYVSRPESCLSCHDGSVEDSRRSV